MVTITASYVVSPEKSTPQGRLWLSDLDQLSHFHRTPLIFVYKPTKNNIITIEKLKNSLSEILVHYYPMAGRLSITENGRIEVDLNAKGAVLFEAETTKTISDYGDFSPSDDSIKQLIPTFDNKPLEEIPIFAAQLTRFSCNKGFVIGTSFFHVLSDGVGFTSFMNSWAKIARGETLDEEQKPFLDRTILKSSFSHPKLLIPPHFDHIELNPPPLILGRSDNLVERNKKLTAELLRLSAEQVEILKKKANEIDSLEGKRSRGYSRYEAIAAHIWICASKARKLEEKQETIVGFTVEIRRKIIPRLPKNYFGNSIGLTATKGYVGEITSKSLGYVAENIRKAKEMVTDEYIKSQVNVMRSKESLDGGGAFKNAVFYGNPNIRFTSWINIPFYEADFGCGKPVYFGLGYVRPYDSAVILLSSDGDGSIIVCMHFQVEHMQLFKKFFYEDIYEMLTSSRL